jgi:hypothetical protein
LYELAKVFVDGGNYQLALEKICSKQGILSEDGDAIIDEYSGYVLRQISFSEEEGYDDAGFKINTHSLMEKDKGSTMMEMFSKDENHPTKKTKLFEDETTQKIYNILTSLAANIHISVDSIDDFVIRVSLNLINNKSIVQTETPYLAQMEKMEKQKGKQILPPYTIYRNQTILAVVGSVLLVAIQTTIPPFQPKKTFPGCIYSFSGYPLDGGIENTTSLHYIACVLKKMES